MEYVSIRNSNCLAQKSSFVLAFFRSAIKDNAMDTWTCRKSSFLHINIKPVQYNTILIKSHWMILNYFVTWSNSISIIHGNKLTTGCEMLSGVNWPNITNDNCIVCSQLICLLQQTFCSASLFELHVSRQIVCGHSIALIIL